MKPHPAAQRDDPDDDRYLYCQECGSFFAVECDVHGPALFIPDLAVPIGSPDRARQTLPPGLEVRESEIPGAGLGVFFTGRIVPVGVHFGPYEGEPVDKEDAMKSGYSWVIYKAGQSDEYVDGQDETHGNWMRYVNCARNEDEQNLVAFQHRGEIFYRCCRLVRPGQELLVWYEDHYAKHLDITFDFLWDQKCSSHEGDAFSCCACPLSYASRRYLGGHVKRCHPEQYQALLRPEDGKTETNVQTGGKDDRSCPDCGETLSGGDAPEKHRCPRGGEGPFHCATCGKRFGKAKALKKHQRAHGGEKQYECATCGKCFGKGAALRKHRRIHTGEKPYRCPDCGKSFIQKCHLQRHQRIHTGEKPYQCLQCGRSFTVHHHLQSHQRIHQREGVQAGEGLARDHHHHHLQSDSGTFLKHHPHRCLVCPRTFSRWGQLRSHQRLHTGEKPYRCPSCGQRFMFSKVLKAHRCCPQDPPSQEPQVKVGEVTWGPLGGSRPGSSEPPPHT